MRIKYYTKHFSFTLPICIVCFLLGACSKVGKLGVEDNTHYIAHKVDEGYSSSSEMDHNSVLSPWSKDLFDAINKAAIR